MSLLRVLELARPGLDTRLLVLASSDHQGCPILHLAVLDSSPLDCYNVEIWYGKGALPQPGDTITIASRPIQEDRLTIVFTTRAGERWVANVVRHYEKVVD